VIRALWDVEQPDDARYAGSHYRLAGAARGPAPRHSIPIWVGAYKPRMLALVGRKADGWLPSMPYLGPGELEAGNAAIDGAAVAGGRDPREIRRVVNTGPMPVDELVALALEDGVATFILIGDDEPAMRGFAEEVAPAVREQVERARRQSLR